jgi:hypothetical protein
MRGGAFFCCAFFLTLPNPRRSISVAVSKDALPESRPHAAAESESVIVDDRHASYVRGGSHLRSQLQLDAPLAPPRAEFRRDRPRSAIFVQWIETRNERVPPHPVAAWCFAVKLPCRDSRLAHAH